jgi:hypothetical protein
MVGKYVCSAGLKPQASRACSLIFIFLFMGEGGCSKKTGFFSATKDRGCLVGEAETLKY